MKIVVDNSVPRCEVPGCDNHAQNVTGGLFPKYRKSKWVREEHSAPNGWVCAKHHGEKVAAKHGLKTITQVVAKNAGFDNVNEYSKHQALVLAKNAGFDTVAEHLKQQALDAGFESYTDWTNSKHPYLRFRKTYCENQDGRLGFKCTFVPPTKEQLALMPNVETSFRGWLHVDHIDGNPFNPKEENLQTLCACCHIIKTAVFKDYATPGRKTLKAA
jgi:hypothetical protein